MKKPIIFALVMALFICTVQSQKIEKVEYFFNNDPGVGNGTFVDIPTAADTVDFTFDIDLTGLSTGFHFLHVRAYTDSNQVSIAEGRKFYIFKTSQKVSATEVTELEYFIDTVIAGTGVKVPITPELTLDSVVHITTTGLPVGNHTVMFRIKDNLGRWSLLESKTFFVYECVLPVVDFNITEECSNTKTLITNLSTGGGQGATYEWDFGNDGSIDYTEVDSILHAFTTSGKQVVNLKVIKADGCWAEKTDTIEIFETPVKPVLSQNSAVTEFCEGDSILITSVTKYNNYVWSNGEQTDSVWAKKSGYYFVSVQNGGVCSVVSDTIPVTVFPAAEIDLGNVTSICGGDSIILDPGEFAIYKWQNNAASRTFAAKEEGMYKVSVENQYSCTDTDSIYISWHPVDTTYLTITLCEGNEFMGYSSTGNHTITKTSMYGCDSIIILDLTINSVDTTAIDTVICEGEMYDFYGSIISESGIYYYTETGESGCDSVLKLDLSVDAPVVDLGADAETERNTPISLDAGAGFARYYWSSGDTTQIISKILRLGDYTFYVDVFTENNCTATDTINYTIAAVNSINSIDKTNISVYPNPTKDIVNIAVDIENNPMLKIYNSSGQLVLEKELYKNSTAINLGQFGAAGFYYLEVYDNVLKPHKMVKIRLE